MHSSPIWSMEGVRAEPGGPHPTQLACRWGLPSNTPGTAMPIPKPPPPLASWAPPLPTFTGGSHVVVPLSSLEELLHPHPPSRLR